MQWNRVAKKDKTKAKKKKVEEEKEVEEDAKEEEEEETTAVEYAEGDNPMWVEDPPALTVESPKGRRLHIYDDDEDTTNPKKVIVTGKDWEDKKGIHPGKAISMSGVEFNALVFGYLREVYDYDFEAGAADEEAEEDE